MLRISLIDDDVEFLEIVKKMLHGYLAEKAIPNRIDSFSNPEMLYLEFSEKREYDICFLDIEMPQMDGRELAEKIRELNDFVYIVFLTSHREFVKVGYRVRAFDFITKDQVEEELTDVMDRLLRRRERDAKEAYMIRTHSRYEVIPYKDIIYIYKQDQNIRLVLKTEERSERKSLRKILEELDKNIFMLVERGYIVNLGHIVRINAREILLSNGKSLTISKEHIQDVREKLGMYCVYQMSDI